MRCVKYTNLKTCVICASIDCGASQKELDHSSWMSALKSQLLASGECVRSKRDECTHVFFFDVPLRLRIEPSCCVEVWGGGGR